MNSYRSKFMFWLNYAPLDGKKPIWKSISGHSLIYYAAISNDDKTIQNKFTPFPVHTFQGKEFDKKVEVILNVVPPFLPTI